jgi:hypothetical protein
LTGRGLGTRRRSGSTYDLGDEFPMVDGIATMPDGRKAAWFADSEGNTISLFLDM